MSVTARLVAFASQSFPRLSSRILASSGYTLDVDSFGPNAFEVWDANTAERQERAWAPLVRQAIEGSPREDIAALFAALDTLAPTERTILETGCGGGYNSELIAHHKPALAYTGIDLSPAMIEIARRKYPLRQFMLGSATDLEFDDDWFDVVMDGVVLLHIPSWRAALREYARVARQVVILHGLTLTDRPTTTFAKYAYGQASRELVFNRDEMLSECQELGMTLRSVHPGDDYDLESFIGIPSVSETWVLQVSGR